VKVWSGNRICLITLIETLRKEINKSVRFLRKKIFKKLYKIAMKTFSNFNILTCQNTWSKVGTIGLVSERLVRR
jgi:hypothetical protein